MSSISRRLLLGGSVGLPLVAIQTHRADAAPVFRYRLGTNLEHDRLKLIMLQPLFGEHVHRFRLTQGRQPQAIVL